jgi:hypothetical protein
MVDNDGSYALSRIISDDFGDSENRLSVFSNPAQNQLRIALSGMDAPVKANTFNGSDLLLIEKTITDIDQIDIGKIPAGIYTLKVTDRKVNFIWPNNKCAKVRYFQFKGIHSLILL